VTAPDHLTAQARLFDLVREAMARIPEDQRTAILLREYQGLTSEEIGEITGVPRQPSAPGSFTAEGPARGDEGARHPGGRLVSR